MENRQYNYASVVERERERERERANGQICLKYDNLFVEFCVAILGHMALWVGSLWMTIQVFVTQVILVE